MKKENLFKIEKKAIGEYSKVEVTIKPSESGWKIIQNEK